LKKLLWLELVRRFMYIFTGIIIVMVAVIFMGYILHMSNDSPMWARHILNVAIFVVILWWFIQLQLKAFEPLEPWALRKKLKERERGLK